MIQPAQGSQARCMVVDAAAVAAVFNRVFACCDTRLVGGASEPLYMPARDGAPAKIHYRNDYLASALHESAHWCIAGAARRRQVDYGYWYAPDGRDAAQQRRFVQVEARPQALEWIFSLACDAPFRISVDNLESPPDLTAEYTFADAVAAQARGLQREGLPARALLFFAALRDCFNPGFLLAAADFSPGALSR